MNVTNNVPMFVLVVLLVLMYLCAPRAESFSDSGLAISDRYCEMLANAYYRPEIDDATCRSDYVRKVCGYDRRNTIEDRRGNYYTEGGVLI